MTDESTSPAGTANQSTDQSTTKAGTEADIRMSPEDMDRMDKYIAEQRKLSEASTLAIGEEAIGEEAEADSKEQKSEIEQAYEALQAKYDKFVERMRDNYLLAELPVKLQEEYKDRTFEELELLVEYLKKQSGKAGVPRIPKTKIESTPKKPSGHVGGYDSTTKTWT